MTMAICLLMILALGGCYPLYSVPWEGADFAALGLEPVSARASTEAASRVPLATFPAAVAAIRLQGHRTAIPIGVRTCDTDLERLRDWPRVRAFAPMTGLVCPEKLESVEAVRRTAAGAGADVVLVYTFASDAHSETSIPVLGVLTLGLFPNEVARVSSTASAALIDTRSGYIYGLAEASAKEARITNAWNIQSAIEQGRRGAENTAFQRLLPKLETLWRGMVAQSPAAAVARDRGPATPAPE